MSVGQWVLSIVLFILSLGVLIIIHELGHLSMAKLFNVYCQEFSIGFGPALLHKRKEGKETYFSIRAVPLGGYVSMYGEGMELEDGVSIPKERSIEGIKRWKKAIVLGAGVILNALLALTLFAISDICFPTRMLSRNMTIITDSVAYNVGMRENDKLHFLGPKDNERVLFDQEQIGDQKYSGSFYILNDDVTYNDSKYVLCWAPSSNNSEPLLTDSIKLLPGDKSGNVAKTSLFTSWAQQGILLANYPDVTQSALKPYENTEFTAKLGYYSYLGKDEKEQSKYSDLKSGDILFKSVKQDNSYKWEDVGVRNKIVDVWYDFGTRIKKTFIDFGNASIAVFKGIANLFTGGFQNMSGIIGIFSQSATLLSNYTFSTYLYFWGLISVNLAIFNLLPFPGLDGWQLLVTAIEGGVNSAKKKKYAKSGSTDPYVEWKIPAKVKSIMSFVGLALLFILMIAIVGLDIARLIK